jgi:prolyl 4-hydroxylase
MKSLLIGLPYSLFLHTVESRWISPSYSAFAGGFGGGKSPPAKGKTTKGKKKKGGLADMQPPSPMAKEQKDDAKLDKWGLPVATIDDLFPPMGPDTELIPVDTSVPIPLEEIEYCLRDHLDLQLGRFFDSGGTEMNVESDRDPMKLRLLHKSPPVLRIDNFFIPEECQSMKAATGSAHEVGSATFTGALSTRTSTSWFCNFVDVSVLLAKANHVLNIPLETMEEPQVVRYKKGQEFSWHYDEVPTPQLKNGGQRLATLLVYLTDIPKDCGGGTAFRDLQFEGDPLVMQPKEGAALLFFPAFRDGTPDDRTLHRSEAMTCDTEKWIVQMWVHKNSYEAVLPENNSNVAARSKMKGASRQLGYE